MTEGPTSERKAIASSLDDTELLAALRRRDRSAATALYTRARPQIDATIVSVLRVRGADHEDLVQLSLIELVGSIRAFRGDCSLDTWISRITARTVFKELRRRQSEGRLLAAVQVVTELRGGDPGFERQLDARATIGRIQKHLDAIDPTKAWVVLLHDVCGYDLGEIAEITEASVAASQSRLVRGRAELHARIARDPELKTRLDRNEKEEDE